jgi:hypothetical protein
LLVFAASPVIAVQLIAYFQAAGEAKGVIANAK